MNIQERFLQKAIEDKNYISFTYLGKKYKKVQALSIVKRDNTSFLETKDKSFQINIINKLIILKDIV